MVRISVFCFFSNIWKFGFFLNLFFLQDPDTIFYLRNFRFLAYERSFSRLSWHLIVGYACDIRESFINYFFKILSVSCLSVNLSTTGRTFNRLLRRKMVDLGCWGFNSREPTDRLYAELIFSSYYNF